jgi:hypothetical protein
MTKRAGRTQRPPASTPHVDTQSLSDTGTYLYETIATLEYAGQRPSRTVIASAGHLNDDELDRALSDLIAQGLLTVTGGRDELVYGPARRSWSTQPGQAAGHPMS